jgi:mono/diheme cytochrome c family protein
MHRLAETCPRIVYAIEEVAMRALIVSAVFSIASVVTTAQAQDVGDIRQGRRLALDICASCHAVRTDEISSPNAAAPSFRAIAHTPGMTAAAVTVWLTAHPHHKMPYLILSGQQVRDVSAYILSLQD